LTTWIYCMAVIVYGWDGSLAPRGAGATVGGHCRARPCASRCFTPPRKHRARPLPACRHC